jgi:hypothetical protein
MYTVVSRAEQMNTCQQVQHKGGGARKSTVSQTYLQATDEHQSIYPVLAYVLISYVPWNTQFAKWSMLSAKHLLLQWCQIPHYIHPFLWTKSRKDMNKLSKLENSYVLPTLLCLLLLSTIREVSSFSCWLLNLDKVGRLLLILSGRNLEIFGKEPFMTANYNQKNAWYRGEPTYGCRKLVYRR